MMSRGEEREGGKGTVEDADSVKKRFHLRGGRQTC